MAKKPPNLEWHGFTEEQRELLDFIDFVRNNGWSRNSQTEIVMPKTLAECEAAGLTLTQFKQAMAMIGYSIDSLHQLDRWESKRTTGRFDPPKPAQRARRRSPPLRKAATHPTPSATRQTRSPAEPEIGDARTWGPPRHRAARTTRPRPTTDTITPVPGGAAAAPLWCPNHPTGTQPAARLPMPTRDATEDHG